MASNFHREGGLIGEKYKEYLFPTIVCVMSIHISTIINGIIVGNALGVHAMAAVNVSHPLILLFEMIIFLFGAGGTGVIAFAKGERNDSKANAAYTLAIISLCVISIIVVALEIIFHDELIHIICNDKDLYPIVWEYVRVLILGAPFMILVSGFVYLIRVDGHPRTAAIVLFTSNVVGILLNVIFVFLFKLGIWSTSLAFILGYIVGLILVIKHCFSKNHTLKLVRLKKSDFSILHNISEAGSTETLNAGLVFIKSIILNRIILSVGGGDAMAIFAVCNSMATFLRTFISGSSETMAPMLGMLYGSKDQKGTRILMRHALKMTFIASCCLVLIILIFPRAVLFLYGVRTLEHFALGIEGLRIFAVSLIGISISSVFLLYYHVTSHKHIAMIISLLRGCILAIALAWILSMRFGIIGFWWSFVLTEGLTLLYIICTAKVISIRSKGKVKGLLLKEKSPEHEYVYDVTMKLTEENAVIASDELIEFGKTHGINDKTSIMMGLVIEEASLHILSYNENAELEIDVLCRVLPDSVTLALRDNGKPFDVAGFESIEEDDDQISHLNFMKKIAKNVEYSRIIGLNNTVITI